MDSEDFCRMCGWDADTFWENGWPTSAICDCCGSESGIGDMGAELGSWDGVRGLHDFRGWWVGHGAQWWCPRSKPRDWDVLQQVMNIPAPWRTPPPPPPPPSGDRAQRVFERAASSSPGIETVCRICGLAGPSFWRDGVPTETRCPSCGSKSGIDDLGRPGNGETMRAIRTRRGYWVGLGAPWYDLAACPKNWDALEQFGAIPPAWR
ncbi:hypothetical protein AB0I66_34805 [Streptomyces sp. NPDC050439]|uniref:hypothetical protein n=1 Tax=unclassified Streptomyces TaxID=2593676 RepID=UPI00343554E4